VVVLLLLAEKLRIFFLEHLFSATGSRLEYRQPTHLGCFISLSSLVEESRFARLLTLFGIAAVD
jgi:hypothetical protein